MTATTEDRASALRSSLDDAAKLIGSQRQTISELREALKPFAEKAGDYHFEDPGHHGVVFISDLRRARAALSRTGE